MKDKLFYSEIAHGVTEINKILEKSQVHCTGKFHFTTSQKIECLTVFFSSFKTINAKQTVLNRRMNVGSKAKFVKQASLLKGAIC